MTLTAPDRGMDPAIAYGAQSKILTTDGVDVAEVQLVWDPPWNQNMIIEAGRMKLARSEAARACSALVLQWSQAEGLLDCVIAKIFWRIPLFSH